MSQAGLVQDAQSSSCANGAGSMSQTPTHDHHNAGLLALIPPASRRLVEIGCVELMNRIETFRALSSPTLL